MRAIARLIYWESWFLVIFGQNIGTKMGKICLDIVNVALYNCWYNHYLTTKVYDILCVILSFQILENSDILKSFFILTRIKYASLHICSKVIILLKQKLSGLNDYLYILSPFLTWYHILISMLQFLTLFTIHIIIKNILTHLSGELTLFSTVYYFQLRKYNSFGFPPDFWWKDVVAIFLHNTFHIRVRQRIPKPI